MAGRGLLNTSIRPARIALAWLGLITIGLNGLGLAGPTPSASAEAPAIELTATDRVYGLSVLWMEAKYNFAFFDRVPDLDWDAAYRTYLPRVLAAEDPYQYYRLLQRLYGLLEDGHTGVYLPNVLAARNGRPLLETIEIDRRAFVINASASLVDRVPLGSELLQIDGAPTATYAEREVLPYLQASSSTLRWWIGLGRPLLDGPADASIRLVIRPPQGAVRTVDVDRVAYDVVRDTQDWVRAQPGRAPIELSRLDGGLLILAINTFDHRTPVVEDFLALLPTLHQAHGIVLDLRHNTGGSDAKALALLPYLTPTPLADAPSRSREHRALFRAYGAYSDEPTFNDYFGAQAELYRRHYQGDAWRIEDSRGFVPPAPIGRRVQAPIAVLIGPDVASAAENFLLLLAGAPHVTRIGRTTAGSTGQPLPIELPGGGYARVCTRRATFADGSEFAGIGIVPDIAVPLTLEEALGRSDPTLEQAVATLRRIVADDGRTIWAR